MDAASWVFLALALFLTSGFVLALQLRQSAVAARRNAEAAERALAAAAVELEHRAAQLERSLVELQRSNRELEDFAYVAGHVQLLERRNKGRLGDGADEFIGFAVNGANRMKHLIQDLLAYSRVGTRGHPFAPTDLQAVAPRSLATLALALQESGGTVDVGALPTVPGDEVQLEELVTNLPGNALKFAAPDRRPVVAVTAKPVDGGWEVSVVDNGIGIPPSTGTVCSGCSSACTVSATTPAPGSDWRSCTGSWRGTAARSGPRTAPRASAPPSASPSRS